jgi:hypothetical protein
MKKTILSIRSTFQQGDQKHLLGTANTEGIVED